MGFTNVTNMSDHALQRELVHHYEKIKRSAIRMNQLGAEMVARSIIKGYEKMYYPNIWNHGQREVTE